MLTVIEHLKHHDDDRMEHLIRIGVIGVREPLTVGIESDFYEWPRIKEIQTDGGINLPARLLNLFIFKCFDQLWPALDGLDIAEWVLPDATPWVKSQFPADEAEILLTELRRHVTPGLVGDPARCTSMIPVILPPQGDQP